MKLILTDHLITCKDLEVKLSEETMGILVDGERIRQVAPLTELKKEDTKGAEVLDFRDFYVMPGMIDGHLHLSFSASEQPLNEL